MEQKLFYFSKRIVTIISVCIAFGIGASLFAVWNVYNYKQQRIKKTQKELSIHVEVISNGIKEIFEDHYEDLKTIANEPDVIDALLHQKTHDFSKEFCSIENMFTQHQPEMSSITIIDKEGKMFHRHPVIDSIMDYSDLEDVAYVLHQNKLYISNVFINTDNKPAISISKPVFENNNFIGIVRITVFIETIMKLYVEPVERKTRFVTIFNNSGNFLHHREEYQINKNYKEVITEYKAAFPKHNWKSYEEMMEKIIGKESGTSVFDNVNTKTNKIRRSIAAFNSVQVFNKDFSVVVSKDYKLVMLPTKQYINKFFAFIFIILILFSIVTSTLFNSHKKRLKLFKENEYLKEISEKTIVIKKQKEFSEKIIQTSRAVIVGLDKTHKIKLFNEGAEKVTGFLKEEVINKGWFEVFYQPKIYEMDKVWEDAWGEGFHSFINPIINKTGEERIISWQTTGVYDDDDEAKHLLISIGDDITERKKMEEELRLSEELFSKAFHSGSLLMTVSKVGDGTFVEVNENFIRITGYSKEDCIGISSVSLGLISKEDREVLKQTLLSKGKIEGMELMLNKKSGEKFYCLFFGELITVAGSQRMLSIAEDITVRKQAEEKLIDSEEKFRMLFNSANDAIFLIDEDVKIIEVNDEAVKRYGYSKKEFLSMKPNQLLPPDVELQMKEEIETVRKSEGKLFSFKHKKADGTIFPVEISIKKIIYNKETVVLAFVRDITEREKARQDILNATILAEEKERSRVAKDLHDGVSPLLSTINLFVQTLKKPKTPEIQNELYVRIESVLQETIKSVSEISNNLSPHVLFNFGLNTAIERFIENLSQTGNININFKSELDDKLNDKYKTSLYRVTTELLNNTYKYANATKIIISITKNTNIALAYKDNGKGFNVKKAISGNKGMGLFNIINRIESLNGNVVIDSKKGKGLNVLVTLPID